MKKSTYHIPYSQNNGARSYMAAEAAARRVPPVPRRNHLFVHTLNFRLFHECRRKQLTSQGYDNRKKVGKITYSLLGPPPHPASVWGDVSASGKHRNREPLIWLTRSHVTTGGWFLFFFWPGRKRFIITKCFRSSLFVQFYLPRHIKLNFISFVKATKTLNKIVEKSRKSSALKIRTKQFNSSTTLKVNI